MLVTSRFCTIGGHFDPPVGDGNVLRSSTKLSARAKREVENTTKLYPGPTIQSRPCFGLVCSKDYSVNFFLSVCRTMCKCFCSEQTFLNGGQEIDRFALAPLAHQKLGLLQDMYASRPIAFFTMWLKFIAHLSPHFDSKRVKTTYSVFLLVITAQKATLPYYM